MLRFSRIVLSFVLCGLIMFGFLGTAGLSGAKGANVLGTIAYTPANTRNEIRLINPDGTGNRQLWSTGRPDQEGIDDIWSMAWRPDGGALVFASTHEELCSINHADIFTVNADGTGYKRITEAPSCAGLASYPKGTVKVPVKNSFLDSFTGFAYFQGASSAQMINLPPGGSTVVTFSSVADFGGGFLQLGGFFQGPLREISGGTAVDVVAGGTVTTGTMDVWALSDYSIWETHSPTWRFDGQQIAYGLNLNSARAISPNAVDLDFGANLLAADQTTMPDFVSRLAYGPTAATANQILYVGSNAFDSDNVYLTTEGSSTPGTPLVTHDFTESILGLAWLPDGSGFAYAVKEYQYSPEYVESANIYVYTFASKKATRVTNLQNEFAGQLSVSPDGQQIVFERGSELDLYLEVVDPDLWIINRNGSGLHLLVANGRAPAWSPATVPGEVVFTNFLYLPVTAR